MLDSLCFLFSFTKEIQHGSASDQALSIFKQLAADFPTRPEFRHDLAKSHGNRGNLLNVTGRLKEAEQDYDQALSLHKQLAADFPTRPEFRHDLAQSHNNRGVLVRDTGRLVKHWGAGGVSCWDGTSRGLTPPARQAVPQSSQT
jgi:tetratricopeptide (TPR) repeat protein